MTNNKYTEELTEWAQKKKNKRPRDLAKVTFLALRKDVEDAMANGFPMTLIWEHLRETGRVTVNYDTFIKYVARYIKNGKRPASVPVPVPVPEPVPVPVPASEPVKQTRSDLKDTALTPKKEIVQKETTRKRKASGFTFNAKPDKDKLF